MTSLNWRTELNFNWYILAKNDAAPKTGSAGRTAFLTLSYLLRFVEKHFLPALGPPGFGPGDLGSIIPAGCLMEITACRYIQAPMRHPRGPSHGGKRDSGNLWQYLRKLGETSEPITSLSISVITASFLSNSLCDETGNSDWQWDLKPRKNSQIHMTPANKSPHSNVRRGKEKKGTNTHYLLCSSSRFCVLYIVFHLFLVKICGVSQITKQCQIGEVSCLVRVRDITGTK